jgi:hypothetical protein
MLHQALYFMQLAMIIVKNSIKTASAKAGVIQATKLLQLATKSDFNAC